METSWHSRPASLGTHCKMPTSAARRPAVQALTLSGSLMGPQELQVAPSRTAIVPVKTDFLPSSVLEREAVARTVSTL